MEVPGATRTGVVAVLRVREAWDAALSSARPEATGAGERLRRRWIAAVLGYGQSAAEGWLTLLEAAAGADAARAVDAGAADLSSDVPYTDGGVSATLSAVPGTDGVSATSSDVPFTDDGVSATSSDIPGIDGVSATATDVPATAADVSTIPTVTTSLLRSWTAEMPVRTLAELAVSGHEVTGALEKRPGPWLGILLNQLLLAVAAGDLANDTQSLLQAAQRMDRDE